MANPIRIKICGITSEEDAVLAAALGTDAIGLNFYPQSPRYVSLEKAEKIVRALPPFVEAVGVFVNEPLKSVCGTAASLGIRTVQWHGDDAAANEIRPANLDPIRLIATFRIGDARLPAAMALAKGRSLADIPFAILVDAYVPGQFGGTGQTIPWQFLTNFLAGCRPLPIPLILAGGLTPDNVAEAIRTVQPYAVDVASGVESSPGKKDPEKLRRFIENARGQAVGGS